jgi:hypothetical protein
MLLNRAKLCEMCYRNCLLFLAAKIAIIINDVVMAFAIVIQLGVIPDCEEQVVNYCEWLAEGAAFPAVLVRASISELRAGLRISARKRAPLAGFLEVKP